MSDAAIFGRDIIRFRTNVLGQTQVQFARWLSEQTGESINTQAVCRYERFRAAKACNPLRPSDVTIAVIKQFYDAHLKEKKAGQDKSTKGAQDASEDSERAFGQLARLTKKIFNFQNYPMLSSEDDEKLAHAMREFARPDSSEVSVKTTADLIRDIRVKLADTSGETFALNNKIEYVHQIKDLKEQLEEQLQKIDAEDLKLDSEISLTLQEIGKELQYLMTSTSSLK